MRETQQKQIGARGYTYHVTQFGARHGGRVLVRLLKMIGGAAGEAMQSDGEDPAVIGKVLANLSETINEADFDYLCDTFMKISQVEGGEYGAPVPLTTAGVFDLHFAGAYQELGSWLLFCIEVNFGGFLGAAGVTTSAANAARRVSIGASADVASQSKSPKASVQSGVFGA